MSPHAPRAASASRWGNRAVSSSDSPVSGRGSPPRPSSESNTILVAFSTTSGAMTSSIPGSSGLGVLTRLPKPPTASDRVLRVLHGILEHAEAGDLQPADVARLHEDRRFLAEADAGRRPRRDEIAGLERHEAREIAHDVADVE